MNTTILIIEDNKPLRTSLARILRNEGYTVIEAEYGMQGIVFAREHSPDLILSDIAMPDMDGYEVLNALQSIVGTTPFVFLTAKAEEQDLRRALSNGADDYIIKPVETSELLSVIRTYLVKYRSVLRSTHRAPVSNLDER